MRELRPYQTAAVTAVHKALKAGVTRQLLVMCTGSGKTPVLGSLVESMNKELPGQTLFLAHRYELISQGANQLYKWNPTLKIQVDMADEVADPDCDVIVSSIATLGRNNSSRRDRFDWSKITKCLIDEAHLSAASSYKKIMEHGGFLSEGSHKLLLGVTATPSRGDGKALAEIYQKIVYTYGLREAIQEGWLVDVRGLKVNTGASLDGVKTTAGDFDAGQLQDTINTPQRNQLAVKTWLEHAEGRQTLAFTAGIQHAKDLAAAFQAENIKAEAIWGDDPDREAKIKRLRSGETRVLSNAQLLVEGFDQWTIACVLMVKPTKSSVFFSQAVGRSTRLQEGTGNLLEAIAKGISPLKKDCLIIDLVDNSSRHSLVTLPTLLGLNASMDLKGKSLVKSLQKIEATQREYPHLDLSGLTDIDNVQAYVENVNLFDIKLPTEVENNSELSWHRAASGGFIIMLPNKESLRITQNAMDKWEISATIETQKYNGVRDTLEEAFHAADDLLIQKCPSVVKLVKQKANWHKDEASPGQLKMLKRLFKGKQIPHDMTKGRASQLIGAALAGKG